MTGPEQVIAGYDGSTESEDALAWAVEEARLRRLPLTVCHAWRWPYPAKYTDAAARAVVQRMGQHVLEHGEFVARRSATGITVQTRLMDGPANAALAFQSTGGALVVIGSRDPDEVPVGSTVLRLPAHAHGPVIVVRREGPADGAVVVGVDSSAADAGSDAAVGFAFEEAALRGRRLRAVSGCWDPGGPGEDLAPYADQEALRRRCGARLEGSVAPWRVKYPQVDAHTSLIMDGPRPALLDAAKDAALLVVGDRSGPHAHPQNLGVTALTMLQRAPCPVAIVHAIPRV
ncbi:MULTISPECIES: universal stress protein [Thermomonosporaceae]|uniref:universal stress protein n=1 Tax=Thermomonosporaceae TaxID=2012 RepID=UPI00255AF66D|nr:MULTISPECIES: universal stress protein [Thermomonosporaceae]MDL4772416.1 universal stress protein [Actinomadura xylanilytica]